MVKKEILSFSLVGFLFFLILFIRVGFIFQFSITNKTLPSAFLIYVLILSFSSLAFPLTKQFVIKWYSIILLFIATCLFSLWCAYLLGFTYDMSWDGQGYQQTAIIAFQNGWNPIYQPSIQLHQKLESQVFAEGYPSALWEVQSSISAFMNKLNSAKVLGLYLAITSSLLTFHVFKKLQFSVLSSSILTVLLILNPIYLVQFLSFMSDGTGYQLVLLNLASLVLHGLNHKNIWALAMFYMSIVLLVSSKYSFVPLAAVLFLMGSWIVINNLMNKKYKFNLRVIGGVFAFFTAGIIFAYLPYARNILVFGYPFYPTNVPDLIGSVRYNNVPKNLKTSSKAALLFYGIFSKSQQESSGDPRSETNIAELKVPFTFTKQEVVDSGRLYNNRAGGMGPWFSGAVVLAGGILFVAAFTSKKQKDRYVVYFSLFGSLFILGLCCLTPAPNLHRYVSQLYFLPFMIIVPILYHFQTNLKYAVYLCFAVLAVNVMMSFYSVYEYSMNMQSRMQSQFNEMKSSKKTYIVSARHFYSNYNLLLESNIPFIVSENLNCSEKKYLLASSTTTEFCELSEEKKVRTNK